MNEGRSAAEASGVAHAGLLVGFADALVARDETQLAHLRGEISREIGDAALREVASVAANFQRMVRIADSTGIPQDAPVRMLADDLVEELDLRRFASAGRTPRLGGLQRVLGRVIRPLARFVVGRAARSSRP